MRDRYAGSDNDTPGQPGVMIRRCYRPQLSALEDLVEFLHRLLIVDPDPGAPDSAPAGRKATCFPARTE